MFAKKYRLHPKRDVAKVFGRGKKILTPFLVFHSLPNSLGYSRFTIVVPSRVSRYAFSRNRLRRLIREATRVKMSFFPKGQDIVIMVRRAPEKLDFQWARRALDELLKKL